MTLKTLPPTLTVEQAGVVLGVSRRVAYRAASTGELPTFRLGRRLLVPTVRVLELMGVDAERAQVDVAARFAEALQASA